ncbi:ABC transporter substrate-binding protein [Spirochaeta thermophila]|uniref:Multiple sugar binding protein n=1 Tax=Winmispira thermophila (strain ATCC 49972 / DSM 6192 / RI 19.B1) TaxID=665571 RepID=E0RPK6_WINT6|nr:extracellular solute-binding protein [Spirochaeta thermophila]ADN02788.1 multiple sugar binding protein [Spirochaeta thermophila DSM 6192]
MKKLSFLLVGLVVAVLLAGCAKKEEAAAAAPAKIVVWSFTDELQRPLDRFKEKTGIDYEFTIVPHEDYMTKLRQVLVSGVNVPDVFTGEQQFVRELVESGYWDDLSGPPYNADVSDMYPYAVEMATDADGKLRGLTWQTTPGGVFYRRGIAKEYLGTDDPQEVGKYFASLDKMLETARMMKAKSGDSVKFLPTLVETQWIPYAQRKHAFVEDGKFILDDVYLPYFDFVKTLRDEGLTAEAGQWGPAWYDGMKKDSNIFAYFGCTWFLHYVLKANAPDSEGDWGLTSPPAFYFWGGTWLGIYSDSKNKENAWKFVHMFTLEEETLEWWAKETGDFISNRKVVEKIKDTFSEPYLGGQNHYAFFAELAPKVNGSLVTGKDQNILGFINRAVADYANGVKSKEDAIQWIKEQVKNAYPELTVE